MNEDWRQTAPDEDDKLVFAFTVEKPECEAIIVHNNGIGDIAWPISTETQAYKLAKRIGLFGFWRLKSRR